MSEENEQVDEKWELIQNLELFTVKERLLNKKNFIWKWTHDLDKVETEYRQFLYLAATHPDDVIVPWSDALDEFWHMHILDTRKYEQDCMAIFGKMFHHDPHTPIGSEKQVSNFTNTKKIYRETFRDRVTSTAYVGCEGIFEPVFCSSCAGVVIDIQSDVTHTQPLLNLKIPASIALVVGL